MLKLVLLLTSWALPLMSEGSTIMDPKWLVKRGSRARYCGSELVDALSLLCSDRGYYDPYENNEVAKRNLVPAMAGPYHNWLAAVLLPRDRNEAEPQASSDQLHTSPMSKRFQSRGIIEECCRTPCSIYDLQSYCKTD